MMNEREFVGRTDGRGFTTAQLALLRKLYQLDYNERDLPKGTVAERNRMFQEAVEMFAKTQRKVRS